MKSIQRRATCGPAEAGEGNRGHTILFEQIKAIKQCGEEEDATGRRERERRVAWRISPDSSYPPRVNRPCWRGDGFRVPSEQPVATYIT